MGHVTSAIPEMSVADIRKGLQRLRLAWDKRGPETPLFLSDPLIRGMSMEEFAMRLILGQHLKRHAKSLLQRAAAASNNEAARLTREEAMGGVIHAASGSGTATGGPVLAAGTCFPRTADDDYDMDSQAGGGAGADDYADGLLTIRGEDTSDPGSERVTLYVLTRTR
jgi:hypothetical protein